MGTILPVVYEIGLVLLAVGLTLWPYAPVPNRLPYGRLASVGAWTMAVCGFIQLLAGHLH